MSGALMYGRGSDDNVVKNAYIFFLNLLLCSWILKRFSMYTVMMKKNTSLKIVKFMAFGSGIPVLWWSSNDFIVTMH